ncbi:hypothetical protein TPDSL_14010 [Terrisporobacter petrolearius]|uniref:phage head closure protein n=1 Tax=Terrisporobacter petrolearius TaxID=1460447 RepID=UPI003366F4E4
MNDILELISFSNTVNERGNIIKSKQYNSVFANKKSISQSEFYEAEKLGFKPSFRFEMYSSEYNDELFARYEGTEYKVLKTYKNSIDKIELTLEGVEDVK